MKDKIITFIKQERTWEILFLGFLFCFYVGWAYLLPFDSCPDERMRYQVVEYIYKFGNLPHGDDPSIRNIHWGISYAFNPILAYMIGALFMKLTSFVFSETAWLILAARMVSVLSGVGMAFFSIRISKKLFPGKVGWLFVALITLLPQSVYIFSYINSDSLALFSISMIVYMWVYGLESKWNIKSCIGLAVGISICAMSYYNAYGFILCSILLFGISALFCYEKKWDYQAVLKKGILISVIVVAFIGWWYIRNYIIYEGDFLGRKTSAMCAELYAIDGLKPSQKHTPMKDGWSIWEMLTKGYTAEFGWLYISAMSFIGCFGYLEYFVPRIIAYPYLAGIGLGLLGNFLSLKQDFGQVKELVKWKKIIFHWCMLIAMIIPVVLSIYYSYADDYQPQGRYCLPMLIPLAYFVVRGLENIISRITKKQIVKDIIYVSISLVVLIVVLYIYKTIIRVNYLPNPLLNIGF